MNKVLTIAVPSYNSENTLSKCINSLIDDTIIDKLEIIIINDGSKDDTSKIGHYYQDKYPDSIKIVDKDNGGHGSGVNLGMQLAKGKYFRVLDSDDWFDKNEFVDYVNKMENINTDVILTNYTRVFADKTKDEIVEFRDIKYDYIYPIKEIIDKNVIFDMTTLTFKTEILKTLNFKLQEKTWYVDNEFCIIPFLLVKDLVFLNNNVYYYYLGQENQSMNIKNQVKNIYDFEKVFKRILSLYHNNLRQNLKNDYNSQYVFKTLVSISKCIYCVTYIYNSDKLQGRKYADEFTNYLKNHEINIFNEVSNKIKVFKLMNYMRISPKLYKFIIKIKSNLK